MRLPLVALSVLLLASPALARGPAPQQVRLEFTSAPTCVDDQTMRNLIAAQLDGTDPVTEDAPKKVTIHLHRLGLFYFTADVSLTNADGKRFEPSHKPVAPDCTALVDEIAIVVGGWLAPIVVPEPPKPPPVAEPSPAPPAEVVVRVVERVVEVPAPPPVEKYRLAFRFGASVRADYATVPRIVPGVSANVGTRYRWFSLDLQARWDPAASLALPNGHEDSLAQIAGGLLICGHFASFVPCLVGEAGETVVSGTAPATDAPVTATAFPHGALGVRLGAEFPIHRPLFVQAGVDFLGSVGPTRVAYRPTIIDVPRFNGGLGAGLLIEIER